MIDIIEKSLRYLVVVSNEYDPRGQFGNSYNIIENYIYWLEKIILENTNCPLEFTAEDLRKDFEEENK